MLEMKSHCERCRAPLPAAGLAWICSYECSWCDSCTRAMQYVCPNCDGELRERPRRSESPA